MTELPLLNGNVPFHYGDGLCISSQSWEMIENVKREYERKLDRAADENDILRREIRYDF